MVSCLQYLGQEFSSEHHHLQSTIHNLMHAHAKVLGLLLVVSKVQALAKRSLASLVQIELVLQLLVQV